MEKLSSPWSSFEMKAIKKTHFKLALCCLCFDAVHEAWQHVDIFTGINPVHSENTVGIWQPFHPNFCTFTVLTYRWHRILIAACPERGSTKLIICHFLPTGCIYILNISTDGSQVVSLDLKATIKQPQCPNMVLLWISNMKYSHRWKHETHFQRTIILLALGKSFIYHKKKFVFFPPWEIGEISNSYAKSEINN